MAGNLLDVTSTDAAGSFRFASVEPGDYRLRVERPFGYTGFTVKDQGSDLTDSDTDAAGVTGVFIVASGQTNLTFGAGLLPVIDVLGAPGSIGDFVWLDDGDGVQEAGEPGLAGVPVSLHAADGRLMDETTTAADGSYAFALVSPGSYIVAFGMPAGAEDEYTFSPADVGSELTDSDAGVDGFTDVFVVAPGAALTSIDAGLTPVPQDGTITVYAWHDMDHDGLQDMGEPGIGPVGVTLKTAGGVVVSSGTTTSAGVYEFTGVAAGSYYLVFSIPLGSSFTLQDQGADDTVDSDVNSSGQTAVFTLAAGHHRTDLDAGAVAGSMGPSSGSLVPLLDEVFRQLVLAPRDEMVAALALVAAAAAAPPEPTNDEGQSPGSPAIESFDQAGTAALPGFPGMPAPLLLASERRSAVDDVFDILISDRFLSLPDNPLEVL